MLRRTNYRERTNTRQKWSSAHRRRDGQTNLYDVQMLYYLSTPTKNLAMHFSMSFLFVSFFFHRIQCLCVCFTCGKHFFLLFFFHPYITFNVNSISPYTNFIDFFSIASLWWNDFSLVAVGVVVCVQRFSLVIAIDINEVLKPVKTVHEQ